MLITPKPTLDERKFREFYVNETECSFGYSLDYWSRSQREEHKIFHVIEYAAIAEMQAEIEKWKERADHLATFVLGSDHIKKMAELEQENKKLREALEGLLKAYDDVCENDDGAVLIQWRKELVDLARKALEGDEVNKATIFIKKLSDDEAEYFLDLALRCIKKAAQCISSTDDVSAKLGIESRIALKNIIDPTPPKDEE